MLFARRKLPLTEAANLKQCPVGTVAPYALMLSPMYVFMRLNRKFVSIKSPMDFFTPEELEKVRQFENFFVPSSIEYILPARSAARSIRKLMQWKPEDSKKLGLAPFEVSSGTRETLIRMILRSPEGEIGFQPFLVTVFTNEFFDFVTQDKMKEARDADIKRFELALFRSSAFVLFSIWLGITDYEYLKVLRDHAFDRFFSEEEVILTNETDEMLVWIKEVLTSVDQRIITLSQLENLEWNSAHKILCRVKKVLSRPGFQPFTAPEVFALVGFTEDEEVGADE